jgi:predicted amidohydrolase YtcJ
MASASTSVRDLMQAHLLIRAGAVHTFDGSGRVGASLAVRGNRIICVGDTHDALDELAGPRTRVVDDRDLAVLPAFHDSHNHQIWTNRDLDAVQLEGRGSIADIVAATEAAARRPARHGSEASMPDVSSAARRVRRSTPGRAGR